MFTKRIIRAASCVAFSLVTVAFVGCRKETAEPSPALAPATAASKDKMAIRARLAEADLVDGEADHIVSKCASCEPGMDGSHEHGIKIAGYELLFCSADCKDEFAKDTNASILALVIPED